MNQTYKLSSIDYLPSFPFSQSSTTDVSVSQKGYKNILFYFGVLIILIFFIGMMMLSMASTILLKNHFTKSNNDHEKMEIKRIADIKFINYLLITGSILLAISILCAMLWNTL
jgi:NADH:ubiquinone oxidoreductase subunit 6 (subunit J)